MQTGVLGKTGLVTTPLGYGGAEMGFLKLDQASINTLLNKLLDNGVKLIDTAAGYPGSEEAIGEAIASRREEYTLVSKCGSAGSGAGNDSWSVAELTASVDRSLKQLRTDHLDVMLLHSCSRETLERGEAVSALVSAREAGKIRFAGYSGDNDTAAYAATLPDIAVVETSVSICDQANIELVLPAARERELGVIAKRPIANAAWKDASQQQGFYADYASTYAKRFAEMNVDLASLGFEGEPALVWPEIALRFTLAQAGLHTAIIGTTNLEHAEANLTAASKGPLPEDAVQKLRKAFLQAQSQSGETWRGQT